MPASNERTPCPPDRSASPALRICQWNIALVDSDPDQPRHDFDEFAINDLAANLKALGQLCPAIGYTHPGDPSRLILVDGERRLRACRRVPLETLDVVVLAARPNATQLLLTQFSLNQFRRQLTSTEIHAAYVKLLAELKITQAELAARLGVSPSKISKALARDRLLPELQCKANDLEATIVPLIAKLGPEPQREVMTFATTPTDTGRPPTRDQVQAYIEAAIGKRSGPRPKALAGCWNHRSFRIGLKPDDTHDGLVESLKSLIAFVQKNRNVPVANLGLLLTH